MVTGHAQPAHLFLVEFLSAAAVMGHDPVLEVTAHGVGVGGYFFVDTTGAADESDQGGEFGEWIPAFAGMTGRSGITRRRGGMMIQVVVGLPYS